MADFILKMVVLYPNIFIKYTKKCFGSISKGNVRLDSSD